jgi:hypothetical protein
MVDLVAAAIMVAAEVILQAVINREEVVAHHGLDLVDLHLYRVQILRMGFLLQQLVIQDTRRV